MKERAIPGPCNCCPRGPRIQYYSMGLAIWTDCIPKRDIHIYKHTISTQYSAITCLALRRSAIIAAYELQHIKKSKFNQDKKIMST